MEKKGGTRSIKKIKSRKLLGKKLKFKYFKNTAKNRAKAIGNALKAHEIEESYMRFLKLFEKLFKLIMNDTRLNKIKDKISNKLDPNILTKIKNVSSDIYDSLSISSKMNENNSMNIIDLYYKILHDLRIMNDDDRLNQSMRSNVSMVQSLIADDLIERFNL